MAILPWGAKPGTSGGGSGTVTSVSVTTANGVSGSVATATTTPAITLTLGAITPSTVNAVTLSGSSTPTLAVTGTSTISGSNTGDQTITLTGDTTGSGTGSFATTIRSSVGLSGSPTTTTQSPADNSTKIATTAYVDAAVLGQNFKEAARVTTTANLVGVYVSGVFTYTATGVDTIDGVNLVLGDRVLVKNQTTTFQNGIYSVTTAGALGVAGVLTRTTDANSSAEFKTGDSIFVTSGTANSATTWAYTGIDSPTIGTDAITYAQVAGQGSFTAGNGIAITGASIAIDTSITVDKTTSQTLTNKTLTSPVVTGATMNATTIVTDTTTGLTIGTSTSQKLGFFNATPVVQQGATTDLGTVLSNLGLRASGTAYPITTSGTASLTGSNAYGTPSSIVLTNATGTATSLTSGITQALASATTTVNVSSATAPSSGQVLTATSSTAATWQPVSGGLTWNDQTTTSVTAAVNNGYVADNASLVTVTLPSTAAFGSIVEVAGKGAGGWKVAQAASVVIHFGSTVTTTGTGGSLASTNQWDAVRLICSTANTGWSVLSSAGNVTVV